VKTASAPPYLLPPAEAVIVEEWLHADGAAVGDRLDHWDPFTDVELVRGVSVNVDIVREACGLGSDSAFALAVSGFAGRTRLTQFGPPVELGTLTGQLRAPVTLRVSGPAAGGRLDISTTLLLRTPGEAPSPIAPRTPGAVLWEDETRIVLEGGAARFPVSSTEFVSTPRFHPDAAWALDWNPADLEAPVLGGLRLVVNSAHPRIEAAVRSGSSDPAAALIRSFVRFDVGRSFVYSALRNDRFVEAPESFEADSVGRMLSDLITACWAGVPITTLVARSIEDPARLDAELQAYLGVVS
jgi:hypothetical protein